MAVCSYLAGPPAGESVAWGSHWHGRCKGLPLTSLHIFTAHRNTINGLSGLDPKHLKPWTWMDLGQWLLPGP